MALPVAQVGAGVRGRGPRGLRGPTFYRAPPAGPCLLHRRVHIHPAAHSYGSGAGEVPGADSEYDRSDL